MNEVHSCAGINITKSEIQIVEIEKQLNQYSIKNAAQVSINQLINLEEGIDSAAALQIQNAFDEIKSKNSFKSSLLSFTLPPELFITIQLPYDNNLEHSEIVEEFRWELSLLFPYIAAENLAIKYYQLGMKSHPGSTLALVVALNKKFLVFCKNFCKKNNITPRFVDNASVSSNYLICNNFYKNSSANSINVYITSNSATLFINNLSKPYSVQVFSKLDGDFLLKLSKGISEELPLHIKNDLNLKCYITGVSVSDELISRINTETGLKFKRFNPFEVLKLKSSSIVAGIPPDNFVNFTPSTGIALRFT